jgi:hypothetical protein
LTFQYGGRLTVTAVEIEVLTVPNCPHRAEAIARMGDAVTATGRVGAVLTERVIATVEEAAAVGMHGSPTILVDGRDPLRVGSGRAVAVVPVVPLDGGGGGRADGHGVDRRAERERRCRGS